MLDEAVKYGISMCREKDINEAEKDLKTVLIQTGWIHNLVTEDIEEGNLMSCNH